MNRRMTCSGWTRGVAGLLLLLSLTLTGCGNFFVDPINTGGGGGGGTTNGDYVYVLNNGASLTTSGTLSAYSVTSAGLTQLAGSPTSLTASPLSIAVSRPNTFVFVGYQGTIGCFNINSDGTLTASSTVGASLPSAIYGSLATSPDGQWLLALDTTQLTVTVFRINTATCALTTASSAQYPVQAGATVSARSLRMSPNATLVGAALGGAGGVFFTFNTNTGVIALANSVSAPSGATVTDLLFDPTSAYAFTSNVGTTGQSYVESFNVATNGTISGGTTSAAGSAPQSMALYTAAAATGTTATTYLYAANSGDATLTGYTVSGGTLTPLAPATFASSPMVFALALDQTGKYLLASSRVAPDVTLYGFDLFDPSKLISIAQISSSTTSTGTLALAATHGSGNLNSGK